MSDVLDKWLRSARSADDDDVPPRIAPGRLPLTARIARRADERDERGVAAGADAAVDRAASAAGRAARAGGAPRPADARARSGGSLGADLGGVRGPPGAEAAPAASAVSARAYTLGQDIYSADGQYAPADPFGVHLLAHEV